MKIPFSKYQGTGNDFIMINGVHQTVELTSKQIQDACNRRFGIGADGVIIIKTSKNSDFFCDYYNADGSQSFCGNGARCAVQFAFNEGIITANTTTFEAFDGLHEAKLQDSTIELHMSDVKEVKQLKEDYEIYTGSPHYIKFAPLTAYNIVDFGRKIRYNDTYKAEGINVNLVEENEEGISMLTYERGVEDETLSCGTGATAVAISLLERNKESSGEIPINVKGGNLLVKASKNELGIWTDVWLVGPAENVFTGEYDF